MPFTTPEPNAIDREHVDHAIDDADFDRSELESELQPVYSEHTDLVLVPAFRFDGDAIAPPWNSPEGQIFDWLTEADITLDEFQVGGVTDGIFTGTAARWDGNQQTLLIKFASLKHLALDHYGQDLLVSDANQFLSRELAAYELVKALGGEDLVLPICIRDINPEQFLSDKIKLLLAKELKLNPDVVGGAVGYGASVQYVTPNLDNFAEQWASIGSDNVERWARSTDQLRYSIYRAYFYDFILGTPVRSALSFGYNQNTDKLIMTDLWLSFSDAGILTENYMNARNLGWGRSGGPARFIDHSPPTDYDFSRIFKNIDPVYISEALVVATQIAERMNDELVIRACITLLQYEVPEICIASMLLRLAYVVFAPGSVLKAPIEFIKNLCVPIRNGISLSERSGQIIEYVNNIMMDALDESFDVLDYFSAETV